MKTIYFQDKFNPIKFWIVTRTNCRHYTITQALQDDKTKVLSKPLYKATRERLYRISELLWQDKEVIKAMFKQ